MSHQVTAPTSEALAPIVSRVTRRLIPVLLLMYILAFLDRANLGFAKAAFQADTGLSDAAYALGAGIFFLGYAALEVPSNILMRKLGAKIWLARIMISWGIVSALMMFAQTEWAFYILRVLLGITEAGFFPGVILYLTYWIPTQFRGRVNGLFYFGAPLAFIFGGPLSGMLLDLDGLGGLQGWQLMFVVTGALTVAVGIWAFSYLDNGPADAKWLNESERTTLKAALDAEDHVKADHSPKGALRALANPKVLYFCLIYFTIQMSVYGVTFYLPTQIAKLVGAKVGLGVGLMTAVPWGIAIIATFLLSRLADKTGKRRLVATASLAAAAVGIFASALTDNPALGLAALSLGAAGFISVQPVFWTLPTGMLVGAAAAGGIALINSVGSLGGFVAPIAKTWAEASFGANSGLFLLAMTAFLGAVLLFNSHRVSKIADSNPLAQPIAEKVH
ncbi:MFS transporter [Pseudarthrobacter sp. MM222]|uniref:MFS transporter n=1 Tax=Pseudarthrobacter sp. MM222 TaxID=3018929 RepID=UPI00222062F5|nr:MFS transporter [Pseudarthrobacter sp. MM222]CAI3803533.1 Inner membrane transport protein RhmT [Pseudarthrobacter sp. MM222]